jgi:Subtilase family
MSCAMLAGTSMASPHAAGAATLLRNAFPGATGVQVVRCMVSSADKTVTPNPSVNGKINPEGGVLNVQAAYACLHALFPSNPPSPPTPLPPTPSPPTPSPPLPPPVDCRTLTVPSCVEAASGSLAPACTPSPSLFCLTASGVTCGYAFKQRGATCNPENGAVCTGSSPECSRQDAPSRCGPPPFADFATWEGSCERGASIGTVCAATCDDYYDLGEGYTSECLPSGLWSPLEGSGCEYDYNNDGGDGGGGGGAGDSVCGDCSANGLCTEKDGCMCLPTQAGEACSCNAAAGFEEFSVERDNRDGRKSYCTYVHC